MATRQISYSKAATKALLGMQPAQARTIRAKVQQLGADPASLANNVKALKGSDLMRLRVGDYRVVYTADMVVLTVIRIGHRREVYE